MDQILLLFFILVFGVFVFLNGRKRKAQVAKLESSVVVGAQVIMLGGIKGKIVKITDDSVIVESTPGTKIEFVKAAVRQVVEPSLDVPASKPAVKKAATAAKPVTKPSSTKATAAKKSAK